MATGVLPITGMPEDLAVVVNSYDAVTRRAIVTNWALLGSDERQRCCNEIERSRRWTRRRHAEVVVARLSELSLLHAR